MQQEQMSQQEYSAPPLIEERSRENHSENPQWVDANASASSIAHLDSEICIPSNIVWKVSLIIDYDDSDVPRRQNYNEKICLFHSTPPFLRLSQTQYYFNNSM